MDECPKEERRKVPGESLMRGNRHGEKKEVWGGRQGEELDERDSKRKHS